MERGIRNTMPRIVAATAIGVVVALSACKKNDNAATDSTAMSTPADTNMPMTPAPGANTPMMTDAGIVGMVVAANEGEIAAGKMAESKASNADVKAFGRMMVTDHGKMLSEGSALAKRLNITPDTVAADSIRTANKMMADMLTSAKGATFDTAYVNGQVMGHENTLAMLKMAADHAQNADLKKMLTDAQPRVQQHLDRIKDIQGKMK